MLLWMVLSNIVENIRNTNILHIVITTDNLLVYIECSRVCTLTNNYLYNNKIGHGPVECQRKIFL